MARFRREAHVVGNGIEVRTAQALFSVASAPSFSSFSPCDVSPDGKKFVINTFSE
jgi:hypothetical protein